MSETVLDRLIECIQSALKFNPNAEVAPVAVLWTDAQRHWESVIDRVGERYPLVTLGEYDPDSRRGPAYWVRCAVAGLIDLGDEAEHNELPLIVYLPGVAQEDLRAVEDCPRALAPIAELQYRSQRFANPKGRDWIPRALLADAERGLGLNVGGDAKTAEALQRALPRVLDQRLDRLERRTLSADDFDELVNPDPVRSVLQWLDDASAFRSLRDNAEWKAFAQQCRTEFSWDPEADGELTGAQRLAEREGEWEKVWARYIEAPENYPGIPEQLRRAKPDLFTDWEVWPQDNEAAEDQLRNRLRDLAAATSEGARTHIGELEEEHGSRRGTVWAALEEAPLALSLEHLAVVAQGTARPLSGEDASAVAIEYAERGWQVDDAVLRALAAAAEPEDREAVASALTVMYRRWLDDGAKALQARAASLDQPIACSRHTGTVILFVDALRLDIAHRLKEEIVGFGLEVDLGTTPAALPTITRTSKPSLAPIAAGALVAGPDLYAAKAESATKATIQVLRSLMQQNGVEVLQNNETGDPTGSAWTEHGELDRRGHELGIGMVDRIDAEVRSVARRIRELLAAGWNEVQVVTDHGWVLLPNGMEKVDLPPATTEVKKGRCALLKTGAVADVPVVPWFWDENVRVAVAPGASCFEANKEYEHGGVSPQECIVPGLVVKRGDGATTAGGPAIESVKWLGLLCRIEVSGASGGVTADIRGLPADGSTSIADDPKETSADGRISLRVPDEDHEGEAAYVVLTTEEGEIVAQRKVRVGRNR